MRPSPVYDSGQLIPRALQELLEALHYRNSLYQLVRRDILTRYKRSILGVAWLDHGVLKAIGKPAGSSSPIVTGEAERSHV